jgi:hypothetical protein
MSSSSYGSLVRENFMISVESVMLITPATEPGGDPATSYANHFAAASAKLVAWLERAVPSVEAALAELVRSGRLRVAPYEGGAGTEQRLDFYGHLLFDEYQLELKLKCEGALPDAVALAELRDQVLRVMAECEVETEEIEALAEPAFPDPE